MTAVAVISTAVFAGVLAAVATGSLPTRVRSARRTGARAGDRWLPGRLARRLGRLSTRAGSRWSAAQLLGLSAGAAAVTALAVLALTPVRPLAVVPTALAAAAPTMLLRRRALQRTRAIRAAWPDALAMLRGAVTAGRPLSHALLDVAADGPPALRAELVGLGARVQTVGLVPALEAVRLSVAEPVTDRVVEVLVIAHAEGGRIVPDVLADLAAVVDAEVAAADEVDALALEGKLNARIVFALPWAVLVLLTAGEGPFRSFYTSSAGAGVIGLGAVLSLLGVGLVGRLSRTPEPPRVLLRPGEGTT